MGKNNRPNHGTHRKKAAPLKKGMINLISQRKSTIFTYRVFKLENCFSNCDSFMTYQSKDPIISIPLDKVPNKDKVPEASGGGHGIPVEHPTS